MHSSSFNDRSFGNDCRMMHFLVLASFRGQMRKDEGGRDEKSGMVFYGDSLDAAPRMRNAWMNRWAIRIFTKILQNYAFFAS